MPTSIIRRGCAECGKPPTVIRDEALWCGRHVPWTDAEFTALLQIHGVVDPGAEPPCSGCGDPEPIEGACVSCGEPTCGRCASPARDGIECDACRYGVAV